MTKKRIKQKKRHFKMSLFYYTDYTEMKAKISHVIYNITTKCSWVRSKCIKRQRVNGKERRDDM